MAITRMSRRMHEIQRMLKEIAQNKMAMNRGEITREQLRFCFDVAVGKGTTEFYGMIESLTGSGVLKKSEGAYAISKPVIEQLFKEMKEAVE